MYQYDDTSPFSLAIFFILVAIKPPKHARANY